MTSQIKQRIYSIDFLRGIVMILMLLAWLGAKFGYRTLQRRMV